MENWSHGLDLRALAKRFGSPLYLHNRNQLRRNFAAWTGLVGAAGNVRYPVKANPSYVILSELAALGSGADCASGHEVTVALNAGIPLARVSYNTPAPDLHLASWLLRSGATVVADSPDLLAELAGEVSAAELRGKLFVRINPGALPGYRHASAIQRYLDHGKASSQFGIPAEQVVALLTDYALPVRGLHVHVGTQMDNLETFVAGLGYLHELAALLAERSRHRVTTLNLGGGLGIPFFDDQGFPSIAELAAALEPHLDRAMAYEVEPGNALVGDTMALLTRLAAVKETRGRRWGILDVGTDQLVKFTVARWEHQIVGPDHRPLPRSGPDALAGPLCFAGDVLLPETRLDGLAKGDPLLVQHAGAYCEAVASRFNGRRSPAHVLVDDHGNAELVRRAEDLFFEPLQLTLRRPAPSVGDGDGERIPDELLAPLGSSYMRRLANDDRYTVREMRKTGPRSFTFTVDTEAAVPFVAMPLALRIIGDAVITAVGLEMGWREKTGPVWATRLSMSCGEVIPSGKALPCHVTLSPLSPGPRSEGLSGVAHYRLGDGQFTGVAGVFVPAESMPAAAAAAEGLELAAAGRTC